MDILSYNRQAWDKEAGKGNPWTIPVTSEAVAKARSGDWSLLVTPQKPVPKDWFPPLKGARVLGLASGGGQQGPILAAAGAAVTVLDNSPAQLGVDRMVARREGLSLDAVQGDMADLSRFEDSTFDLVIHPCSNCFAPDVKPVWREAFRVLKRGGVLLSGMANPVVFLVDPDLESRGVVQLKYRMPYSDLHSLSDEERRRYTDKDDPLVFAHSLEDQLGGQLQAGFVLTGLYEDAWEESRGAIQGYLSCYLATRALKP